MAASSDGQCDIAVPTDVYVPFRSGPSIRCPLQLSANLCWYPRTHKSAVLSDPQLADLHLHNGIEHHRARDISSHASPKHTSGTLGPLVCFDVRFPEPSIHLTRVGAKTLLYPSAFTVTTGMAHWEVLLRARAIENQCYVIAAAQCGRHGEKRVSYGESMVVSPGSDVLGRLEKVGNAEREGLAAREPQLLVVDVQESLVDEVRRSMPLKRRRDMYPVI